MVERVLPGGFGGQGGDEIGDLDALARAALEDGDLHDPVELDVVAGPGVGFEPIEGWRGEGEGGRAHATDDGASDLRDIFAAVHESGNFELHGAGAHEEILVEGARVGEVGEGLLGAEDEPGATIEGGELAAAAEEIVEQFLLVGGEQVGLKHDQKDGLNVQEGGSAETRKVGDADILGGAGEQDGVALLGEGDCDIEVGGAGATGDGGGGAEGAEAGEA